MSFNTRIAVGGAMALSLPIAATLAHVGSKHTCTPDNEHKIERKNLNSILAVLVVLIVVSVSIYYLKDEEKLHRLLIGVVFCALALILALFSFTYSRHGCKDGKMVVKDLDTKRIVGGIALIVLGPGLLYYGTRQSLK